MLIAASALIALSVLGYLGYRLLTRRLTSRYHRESYAPIELVTSDVAILPDKHHLSDVPWISADVQACQSVSLQMIAAQRGIVAPRRYFDFLIAFTYGASEIPGTDSFFPVGADPEVGLREAARIEREIGHIFEARSR